jgi:SEC-C motif
MKIETYKGIITVVNEVSDSGTNKPFNLKDMPLVRFESYKNPFLMLKQSCSNPECTCNEITLDFSEFDETGAPLANPIIFYFRLNIETWKENERSERSELCNGLVDEFINGLTDEMKGEFRKYYETSREKAKRAAKFDMPLNIIKTGRLISYTQIFDDSESISSGGNACGFIFEDNNYEYFIDDLYCIDPQCNCEIAHLFFLRPDIKNKAVFNSFVAQLDFKKGLRIDKTTLPEKDAMGIFTKWLESDPYVIEVLKHRYAEVKDIGKNLVEKHTKHGKLPVDQKNSIISKRKDKIGRNEPCPCGSGKKYKKCCGVD